MPALKNTASKTKAKKEVNLTAEQKEIVDLRKQVSELEFEVHNLHLDNERLTHRVELLSENTPVHKSTKITKPITVSSEDPFNSEMGDRVTLNAKRNFLTFIEHHWTTAFKSKLFWILLVALPMIFTLLFHILLTLKAGKSVPVSDALYVPQLFENNYEHTATKLSNVLITWLIAIPLIVLPCIILPTFITNSREDNLLKRFAINSINRTQIFWFYMLSSLLVFWIYLTVMFVVWCSLLNFISTLASGTKVWDDGFAVFFEGNVNMFRLFVFTFIFYFGLSALGFYKSMSYNSTKKLVAWGTGLFIFTQMTKMSMGIIDLWAFRINIEDLSDFAEFMISMLIFVVKWMYIFTLPTLVYVATLSISRGPSKWGPEGSIHIAEFDNAWMDWDTISLIIQLVTIALCIAIFVYVWYKKNSIINFETGR